MRRQRQMVRGLWKKELVVLVDIFEPPWTGWRKSKEAYSMVAGVAAEIWRRHLPYSSRKCYISSKVSVYLVFEGAELSG